MKDRHYFARVCGRAAINQAPRRRAGRKLIRAAGRAPAEAARFLVRLYRYTLSPLVGWDCRHLPTCSDYADECFRRFGFWAGGWMTLARLCRCHPLGTSGLDFPPDALPARARWYLPWRYGRWRGTHEAPEVDKSDPAL